MKRELWYSVVVRDRHGKIVSRERRRSKSFLKQWNQTVYIQVTGGPLAVVGTNGELGTASSADGNNFFMKEAAAVDYGGSVIGTGDTAVAIDDYALETQIVEGAGVGQMNYQACTVATSVVSAPNCGFVVSRAFVNNSGAEITVRESGLYMYCKSAGGTNTRCCGVRDVLTTPQAVPNGGSISINYTLRVTA